MASASIILEERDSWDTLRHRACNELRNRGLPDPIAEKLASFIKWDEEKPHLPPSAAGYPMPVGRHLLVIRDADLDLASAVWEAIKASAGAGLITGQFTWAAAAAVAATFYKIGRALLKKTAELPPIHFQIILILRESRIGLTLDQLTEQLNFLAPSDPPHTLTDVLGYLTELSKTRLRNGTVVALVAEDGKHRWSAADV